jgi:hypothetical protein
MVASHSVCASSIRSVFFVLNPMYGHVDASEVEAALIGCMAPVAGAFAGSAAGSAGEDGDGACSISIRRLNLSL